ncbi:MAG: tetratricopeptide repeat protein [Pseudomonadota bacterium]
MAAIDTGSGPATEATGSLDRQSILNQRDRILASDMFVSSRRMREFLDFLVSEAVQGRADRLKEMVIGTAVFGRDESFDPRVDSIVRVEAGRLRSKLRDYYAVPGADDPIVIRIPKGGYAPVFESRTGERQASVTSASAVPAATGPDTGPPHGRVPTVPGRRAGYAAAAVLAAVLVGALLPNLPGDPEPPDALPATSRTIAVLPLRDYSTDSPDYFSEAMTDVLIARLSEKPGLRVTSMASVLGFRDTALAPAEVARQLAVETVVDGSVYRDSGQIRITANLIDTLSGRNLWSSTFTRPMNDALSLQDDVAGEIAAELVGRLLPESAAERGSVTAEAYESYLKGVYWRNRLTAQGFNRGAGFFQQAIAQQPDYAEAYAGLAACHCQLGGHGFEVVTPSAALPQAERLATRALSLDPGLAEPSAVLGIIKFKYDWDPVAAEEFLRRAIERKPSLFDGHLWLSQVAEGTGRHETALRHARSARSLNPLSLAANLNLGWQHFQAGSLGEAEASFDALLEFDPEFWGGYWGRGHVLRERGEFEGAIAAFGTAARLGAGHTLPLAALGHARAIAGDREGAAAALDELQAMAEETYVSPVHVALVYAGLGETDRAFDWLRRGVDLRARGMAWFSVTREFDALGADPRYDAIVRSIGIRLAE